MNVTALLAHPDDELMCAGTLARFVEAGHHVRLVTAFFSDFGPDGTKQGLRSERLAELDKCAATLGVELVAECLPDESGFAWSQRWVQHFEPLIGHPDLLISHRQSDANTSHGHLARVAETLARKNTMSVWLVDQVMPGGLVGVAPNLFVDISAQAGIKSMAVEAYRSQLARYPGLADAIAHRDALYGWQTGVAAAEGFTVARAVW